MAQAPFPIRSACASSKPMSVICLIFSSSPDLEAASQRGAQAKRGRDEKKRRSQQGLHGEQHFFARAPGGFLGEARSLFYHSF